MKTQDLIIMAAAAAATFYVVRAWDAAKRRTAAAATRYNVSPGSDQAAMLAEQDRGFYD